MSGLAERVIEDWLTKSDERSYQVSFAAYLGRSGHHVKYFSPHGPLEHGKDIVSLDKDGALHAFQLKAGDIPLTTWRKIVGEVRETSNIPAAIPGMKPRRPDRAYLVLSGKLSDTVRAQLTLINDDLSSHGFAQIETIELHELIARFAEVFESFFPHTISPIEGLLSLYTSNGKGPQNGATLFGVLSSLTASCQRPKEVSRAASNVVVAAEFLSSPYRQEKNHISTLNTWVIAYCVILRLARQVVVDDRHHATSLRLCRAAIEESALGLLEEIYSRESFIEGDGVVDSVFLPFRKLVVLGYAAAVINSRAICGRDVRQDSLRLMEITVREQVPILWGEGAWNYFLNLLIALRHTPEGSAVAEALMEGWLDYACPPGKNWPKDPYWTLEQHLSLAEQSRAYEATDAGRERVRHSYTGGAAAGLLIRRLRRQALASRWSAFSRYGLAEVIGEHSCSLLEWSIDEADLEVQRLPVTGSWRAMRAMAAEQRSSVFEEDSAWILPYYLCAYPHRASPSLTGELDFRTSPESFRSEWLGAFKRHG